MLVLLINSSLHCDLHITNQSNASFPFMFMHATIITYIDWQKNGSYF